MRIAVVENKKNETACAITAQVIERLRTHPCTVLPCTYKSALPDCDLVVVLGGDGTLLHVAKELCERQIPLLGINLGRVGYLAELEPADLPLLDLLFEAPWQIEERMMLDVIRGETQVSVLNDLVLRNPLGEGVSRIGAYHEDTFIGSYYADGVIVATPTGSTAYSLSAGGSVLDPSLSCISLTPICPVGAGARPLVFSAQTTLHLQNQSGHQPTPIIADGKEFGTLLPGETVQIQKSKQTALFLRLKQDSFCNILRNKVLSDSSDPLQGGQTR